MATIASMDAARETARIQTNRFAEGRLSAADLVDAEAALPWEKSSHALALTHWWQAEDRLRHAVGGLIAGTFLTLLVVPVLFHLLESGRQRVNFWYHGGSA